MPDEPGALPDDVTLITNNTFEQRYDLDTGFVTGTNSASSLGFRLRASERRLLGRQPRRLRPAHRRRGRRRLAAAPQPGAVERGDRRLQPGGRRRRRGHQDHDDRGRPRPDLPAARGALGDRRHRLRHPRAGADDRRASGRRPRTTPASRSGRSPTTRPRILVFALNARYTTAAPNPRFSGDFRIGYQQLRSADLRPGVPGLRPRLGRRRPPPHRRRGRLRLQLQLDLGLPARLPHRRQRQRRRRRRRSSSRSTTRTARQLDFTAQYNHAFTPVITGSVGYRLTQRYEDPGDATSHRVFLQIGRSFVTGF